MNCVFCKKLQLERKRLRELRCVLDGKRADVATGDFNIDPAPPRFRGQSQRDITASTRDIENAYRSTVEPLRRGRALPCGVVPAETDPMRPVEEDLVHAIRPHLSPQVEAIVLLQLHTGARGGELLGLRPKDISIDEKTGVWFSELAEHKTAHHGKRRTLFFGPQSQAVLEPFMRGRSPDANLFSPREAEESRIASLTASRRTPIRPPA